MANHSKEIRYPLKAARQQFSELMSEVRGGARIIITDRGKPVADVIPHNPYGAAPPPRIRPQRVVLRSGTASLADELDAIRGDR